jgi:hypothetical protein
MHFSKPHGSDLGPWVGSLMRHLGQTEASPGTPAIISSLMVRRSASRTTGQQLKAMDEHK